MAMRNRMHIRMPEPKPHIRPRLMPRLVIMQQSISVALGGMRDACVEAQVMQARALLFS